MISAKRMQLVQKPSKPCYPSLLISTALVLSSISIIYFLVSVSLVGSVKYMHRQLSSSEDVSAPTRLDHIVFGIASNEKSWPKRKDYIKLWWKPDQVRGCVFVDRLPKDEKMSTDNSSVPPICISEDASRFRYTYRNGKPSAIRVARVVSEIVALNHPDVRWYVFGDDDTIFFPENLVKTLGKYDHGLWYYIGSNSEIYEQNRMFGFDMAYGGGGFAISAPLAKVLAKLLDSCVQRYSHLYGSDSRIFTCLAELGVAGTRERGFHQIDFHGDVFGFLTSHPLTPLLSLHHLEHVDPIFPNMTTKDAIQHLFKAASVDSQRMLQKTVCYDRWFSWTISISWGYAVEIHPRHVFLPDVLPVQTTFSPWQKEPFLAGVYTFNTIEPHPDPCQRPTAFFLHDLSSKGDQITSYYKQNYLNCSYNSALPRKLDEIKVFSTKLNLNNKQLLAPRRHCCDVLPPSKNNVMEIAIRECKEGELIHMH